MRLLPSPVYDHGGLRVTADPAGFVAFATDEDHAHLIPEDSMALALALIELHAPALMRAIEREVRAQRLRLVQGGGEGDAA